MTICNLIAITLLGKYAFRLLEDYRIQKRNGVKNPVFTKDRMKDIEMIWNAGNTKQYPRHQPFNKNDK